MTTTAPTPGPWHVGKPITYTLEGGWKVYGFPISGHGAAIAAVWNGAVGKEAMKLSYCEANARLIGAAPDLLEALMDIVGVIETDDLMPKSVSYMKQARAAIAKATGEA